MQLSEISASPQRRAPAAGYLVPAMAMLLASVALLVWLEARPRDPLQVAAIFSPWTSGDDAFARAVVAGGQVIRQGATDTILVVHGDDPRLIDRLYAAGAWAVIDPVAFGGCLVKWPQPGR